MNFGSAPTDVNIISFEFKGISILNIPELSQSTRIVVSFVNKYTLYKDFKSSLTILPVISLVCPLVSKKVLNKKKSKKNFNLTFKV